MRIVASREDQAIVGEERAGSTPERAGSTTGSAVLSAPRGGEQGVDHGHTRTRTVSEVSSLDGGGQFRRSPSHTSTAWSGVGPPTTVGGGVAPTSPTRIIPTRTADLHSESELIAGVLARPKGLEVFKFEKHQGCDIGGSEDGPVVAIPSSCRNKATTVDGDGYRVAVDAPGHLDPNDKRVRLFLEGVRKRCLVEGYTAFVVDTRLGVFQVGAMTETERYYPDSRTDLEVIPFWRTRSRTGHLPNKILCPSQYAV